MEGEMYPEDEETGCLEFLAIGVSMIVAFVVVYGVAYLVRPILPESIAFARDYWAVATLFAAIFGLVLAIIPLSLISNWNDDRRAEREHPELSAATKVARQKNPHYRGR